MSTLVMACARLKSALENPFAVERYTIMRAKSYQHPGWVEQEKRLRQSRRSHDNHKAN